MSQIVTNSKKDHSCRWHQWQTMAIYTPSIKIVFVRV